MIMFNEIVADGSRSLLPVIQKYYESDEGKRAFAEWKEKKEAAAKGST